MKLVHFSDRPLVEMHSVVQGQEAHSFRTYIKPNGLWVSVEDGGHGWSDWCVSNEFGLERLALSHEIHLADDPNVLVISNAAEFDAFNHRYLDRRNVALNGRFGFIPWDQVAKEYDGIIIAPYIYSRRLDLSCSWYYIWDCASGCIWNAAAVRSIGEPTPFVIPQERT